MDFSGNYYELPEQERHYDRQRHSAFDLQRYHNDRRAGERQIVQYKDLYYESEGGRDPKLFRETAPVLVRERDLEIYQRGCVENDNALRREGEYFSDPDHRFPGPRNPEPRMPYHQNLHRALPPGPALRGGGPSWQQPLHRNYPPRRRHHLDDIFLPNHDDEEFPIQEEGCHSRHSSYRPPIRVEVRTTKDEIATKDKTASTLKTNEKISGPKCCERAVTSTDSRVKIIDNVGLSKRSESDKSYVKDCATVSKLWTIAKQKNETINNNISINKKETIGKELDKKSDIKTNNDKNISIPNSSGPSNKDLINKEETKTSDNKKVIVTHKSSIETNEKRGVNLPIQTKKKTENVNQSEIVNKIQRGTTSCTSEKSSVIHQNSEKKKESLNNKCTVQKKEDVKKVLHSPNNETKSEVTKIASEEIRKDGHKKQFKDVLVTEIMGDGGKKAVSKLANDISESKKETSFSLKYSKHINQRTSFESKSKTTKVTNTNFQSLSDASTMESKTIISNKSGKIQLPKNDFTNKEKLSNKDCTTDRTAQEVTQQMISYTNDKIKKSYEDVQNRKDDILKDAQQKLHENMSEKSSANSNTKGSKTINNISNQVENITAPNIKEKTRYDSKTDIVKELEALVNKRDDLPVTKKILLEEQPKEGDNKAPINSTEATKKMEEGNLTQDTTPTSVPSSPQAIKKEIRIKLIRSPLSKSSLVDGSSQLLKSPLATVDRDLIDQALPRSSLTNMINKIYVKDKELNLNCGSSSKQPSEIVKRDELNVSKKVIDNLSSNDILKKIDIPHSNNNVSNGSFDGHCTKTPPILEEIFILEDALKNIDVAPEIIEILSSPPYKDSSIHTIDKDTFKDGEIIEICSTPKRITPNLFGCKKADSEDVQLIENRPVTIEIIDDDDDPSFTTNNSHVKPTTPNDVIKIEIPVDCKRKSKSPTVEVEKPAENRPLEDFYNVDTRESFLWTFHQRFDDPRIVDMDISHSPSPSPPYVSEEPVRSEQQQETDRIIKDMDALWNEISDNIANKTKINNKTSKNVELKSYTESDKVNKEEIILEGHKLSSVDLIDNKNLGNCQLSKELNSTAVHIQDQKCQKNKTQTKQDSIYSIQDTLSEKLLPFNKKVEIAGDKTKEISSASPNVAKSINFTSVRSESEHVNRLRSASFCLNNKISFKGSLRKTKSLNSIVSVNKADSFYSSVPIVNSITGNLKTVNDNGSYIQNETNKSKAMSASEISLCRKSPLGLLKPTPFVDYKDELLSLLSSSGYHDQISDKLDFFYKEPTIGVDSGISKKLDLMPKTVSSKFSITNRNNAINSLVQRKENYIKKRKRVRRIESSDEEPTVETPRLLKKDKIGQPKQKKQKLNEKPIRKRKNSLDDKNKEAGKDMEVPNPSPISEESREKCLSTDKLTSLPNKTVNISAQEIIPSTAQTPTKYVTKAEYVKTFAKNKSLVPNISLSIEPIRKIQKIKQRRATFTCEADNEKILRKVDSGERCKQKFLDLFGSISDDEEDLIQGHSIEVGKTSSDGDEKVLKKQLSKDKTDKQKKIPCTSKPVIEESVFSDCPQTSNNPETVPLGDHNLFMISKSLKRVRKYNISTDKDSGSCKKVKIQNESSTQSEQNISDKNPPHLSNHSEIGIKSSKFKRQNSKNCTDTNIDTCTSNKKSSSGSRRESTSSTDSRLRDDMCPKDKGKKYLEKIKVMKGERSKELDSNSKGYVKNCMSKHRRLSLSQETEIGDESYKKETNAGGLKQKHKEIKKLSCKKSDSLEVVVNPQVPITEIDKKNLMNHFYKSNQETGLNKKNKTNDIKQVSKKISNKRKIAEEFKLLAKDIMGSADPLKKLKESCRRNSAPEVLSSSSETSLIIGEIQDLPLLYRASEDEVNETFQICQAYTSRPLKYDKITKMTIVDIECIDRVHISKPPETSTVSTVKKQTQEDDDDVIEIRPVIPMIDLTEEDIRINPKDTPKETLNYLLLDAKKEIDELSQDQSIITLYRSEEGDDNQDEEVQAVAASISLAVTERNTSNIKNDFLQQEATIASSDGCLQANKDASNNKVQVDLVNNARPKISDSSKEAPMAASPVASKLFSNLVQNLKVNKPSHIDNIILEKPHTDITKKIIVTPQLPAVPAVPSSLEDENLRAVSSILDIQQSNQPLRLNTDLLDAEQNSTNKKSVLTAATLHTNVGNENSNVANIKPSEQTRITLKQLNLTNQNHKSTIIMEENLVHQTTDSHKKNGQINTSAEQNSLNVAAITSQPHQLHQRPRIIVRPTRVEKATDTFKSPTNLDMRLRTVQNRMVQEYPLGQHKGLPQTLREYRPIHRVKVTSTVVPPALINIDSTQISSHQMTQTEQARPHNAGVKATQTVSLENNSLSPQNGVVENQQNFVDLTEDTGELSTIDKKIIVDIFTRHAFFLAHLCKAQNEYIEYLGRQSFCQNYFKAEITLFEDQKQSRLLSQSLRLCTELQNLNIRATRNLNASATEIIEKITFNLNRRDMPKTVTKSIIYLLIVQLIKPQTELFTRIPLLKALIRICNTVVGRIFSKYPGTMSEAQKKTFSQQVQEYHRLFGGPALSNNQRGICIRQPNSEQAMSNNYVTADLSPARNPTINTLQNPLLRNFSPRHAPLATPDNQGTQLTNVSGQKAPMTSQPSANVVQLTDPPPIVRLSQFGQSRFSGGSASLPQNLSGISPNVTIGLDTRVPNVTIGLDTRVQIGKSTMHQTLIGPNSMNPPSYNVHMMRKHIFATPRQPGAFVMPNSFQNQTRSLLRPARDLPGGANTVTLGCTPRYLSNCDIPNQSHVYASLGRPRQRTSPQNFDHISNSTTPINSSLPPPSINFQAHPTSPMLSKLLVDTNSANRKSTVHQTPQHLPIPQYSQYNSSERSLMEDFSNPRNNIVSQSSRHNVAHSPRHRVAQSPRYNDIFKLPTVISPNNLYESSLIPPSYEESVTPKSTHPSSSSSPNQLSSEESKKRSENLLNELLSTPDNDPLFTRASSPPNENFRIKLPFTKPDATLSSTIHTTSASSSSDRGPNANKSIMTSESTFVVSTSSQPTPINTVAPTTYGIGQPKETVVLNQGLAALSSIGPASAMLNSSSPRQQNQNNRQVATNIQASLHYQDVSIANQPLVQSTEAQTVSPILIINNSNLAQPQDGNSLVTYNQIPAFPQFESSSSPVDKIVETNNKSKICRNYKFNVIPKRVNEPKSKEHKPKAKPKPKPKPKPKKIGRLSKQKKVSQKIIETVDLLSSDDEITSENQSGEQEPESDQVKRAETQLQVKVSEITTEYIRPNIIDDEPATISNSVTQNHVPEPPNLDHPSSCFTPLNTQIQTEPSTSNSENHVENINNEEDEVETIDLTWIDDLDDQELQREMDFVFVKTEESRDEDEQALDRNNMVVPSPADSGISSPPTQGEDDATVYTVNVERLCICSTTARYNCACGEAWYCGPECQLKDWESHQMVCHSAHETGTEEEFILNEQEVDMPDET